MDAKLGRFDKIRFIETETRRHESRRVDQAKRIHQKKEINAGATSLDPAY